MPTPGYDRRRSRIFPGRWLRRGAGIGALLVGLTAGCKHGGRTPPPGDLTARNTDPLMGGSRIPPQDLPIPGRGDAYGSRDRKDPLLDNGRPAGRGNSTERTESPPPTKKSDAAALPTRRQTPYRPSKTSTPASLAGTITPDDSDLSIGTRPTPGKSGGSSNGPVPLRRDDGAKTGGLTYDEIIAELRDRNATWEPPLREDGVYVFRADVPIDGDEVGRFRRYEGTGATPAAAAKQVLDHVRSDDTGR